MKVLNILSSLSIDQGGPPEVIRNYSSVINKNKKIIVVLKLKSLSLYYLISTLFIIKRKNKFIKFIQQFDIIHFHELWNLKILLISYFANKLGKKTVLIPHGVLDSWSLKEKFLKKKIYTILFLNKFLLSLDAIFFSTKDEYYEARKNFKLPFAFIIPNGINLRKFKKNIEVKNDNRVKKKIIFFGRIHKKKGIELLLNSLKSLPDNFFNDFYFEITGPGQVEYITKIQKIIEKFNLANRVFIKKPKSQNEKINYLKTASLFILPSFEEADSIALKEAMSLSLPVIASEQCRMNIIKEETAGFIVKTESNSIKNKLLCLKEVDLQHMGNNSRKVIEDYFDNEKCVKKLSNIYEDLLTGCHNSKAWINLND